MYKTRITEMCNNSGSGGRLAPEFLSSTSHSLTSLEKFRSWKQSLIFVRQ